MELGRFKRLQREGIVRDRMALSRRIAQDGFPAPIQLGSNTIAWDMEEVYAWIRSRPRRETPARSGQG
jgi:hypothetical protein